MYWTERLNQSATHSYLGSREVEILHWDYHPLSPDNVPHRHTYFEICLIGEYGRGIFSVEGKDYEIGPGDIFFARPGVIHQIRNSSRRYMELFWVCYGWRPRRRGSEAAANSEIDRLLNDFSDSPVLVARDTEKRVTSMWQALRGISTGAPLPGADSQTAALVSSFLLALAQAGVERGDGDGAARRRENLTGQTAGRAGRLAVRYIHDNLYRPVTVEEVASHIHVSPRHLTRLMRDFTGAAPAAYIEQARIDRAHGLLLHSVKSIKEIAAEVGYEDVHHFTRVFTRCTGSSPGRYRAANKTGQPLINENRMS